MDRRDTYAGPLDDARPDPPSTKACAPSDLTATAWWTGATGSMAGGVQVTNVGQRPCVLSGTPRLIQLRSDTTILASLTYRPEQGSGPGEAAGSAGPVLLQPGERAGAFLIWTNWCQAMRPIVTSLLVTLPDGGSPLTAGPTSSGPGFFGTPRCDRPTVGSSLSAWAFLPVPPQPPPPYEPQPASVSLALPASMPAGGDLAFLVTLTNEGSKPASLTPCPTYTEDLIVDDRALKPPAPEQLLLNCAAIGPELEPGASVTLQMRYTVPAGLSPGPVELVWGMDPGGPFDAATAIKRASITVASPG